MEYFKLIFNVLILPYYPIWLFIIFLVGLRIFIERKRAKRNAQIEYENQKQAYKDALREYEKEKESN